MTRSATHAAALAYAALGWPVFPLAPRSKVPAVKGSRGVLDATTDPAEIDRLWRDLPDAGIGGACGIRSGWFVVDVDTRNDGDASMAELESEHGRFPATVESCTGGGGRHLLYRCTTDLRGTVLAMGVDIKAGGGYIVLPPSIHPSGRAYCWEASSRPGEVEIAEPPEWLIGQLTARKSGPVPTFANPVDSTSFMLGVAFAAAGLLGPQTRPGVWWVCCPWLHLHTDGRGDGTDSSTVLFAPKDGCTRGLFHCSHSHCEELT